MIYLLFTLVGALLLLRFVSLRQVVRQMSPAGIFLLAWGFICLTGGLSLVFYNELKWEIVGMVLLHSLAFAVGLWLVPGATLPVNGPVAAHASPRLPEQALGLIRFICLLIFIGYVGRYLHITRVQGRVITDIQQAYMQNQEANYQLGQQGSWFSRFGFLMFLWPLPASVLAWYYRSLNGVDRLLMAAAGFGHAVYATLQAGRSGTIFNLGFMVPLFLLGMFLTLTDRREMARRLRLLALVVAGVASVLVGLIVAFGIRTSNVATGVTFSESFELSPVVRWLMELVGGSNVLTEGAAGALGYVTQPLQRLSLFTDLSIDFKFYGAFNFDLFGNLLRRVGIGEANYRVANSHLFNEYTSNADAPVGTFSTCIRDYYLDFGWAGVVLGGLLTGFLAQRFYCKVVVERRLEFLPLLGFMFAHIIISPLFSGLQTGGANFSLLGSIAAFFILRQFLRLSAAGPRPTLQGAATAGPVPTAAGGPSR